MELCAKSSTPHLRLFLEFSLPALQYWGHGGIFGGMGMVWLDSGILDFGFWILACGRGISMVFGGDTG